VNLKGWRAPLSGNVAKRPLHSCFEARRQPRSYSVAKRAKLACDINSRRGAPAIPSSLKSYGPGSRLTAAASPTAPTVIE
jgi:hypothetical protein